jgi:hypothetical protein
MREGISVEVSAADRARLEAVVADRNRPQKHLWTPPAPQALSSLFQRWDRLLPSIRPVDAGRCPLALMRSAGRRTITSAGWRPLLLHGLARPRSDLFRHHVEDRPRSSWKE